MSSSTPKQNNGERISILEDAIKESEMELVKSRDEAAALKKEGSRGGLFGKGGRFSGGSDPIMEKFNESINFDKR